MPTILFDEPTANLDDHRRDNLAEQILNVKGFSQLFVISHDDTFEQDTDNVVRVVKENGVSRACPEPFALRPWAKGPGACRTGGGVMFQPTALTGNLTCATIKCLSKALLYHIPLWPAGG